MAKTKFGAGHASAMVRLGMREIRNAANPSRESIAADEPGLYLSKTPGEVADERRGVDRSTRLDHSGVNQSIDRTVPEQSGPELEL